MYPDNITITVINTTFDNLMISSINVITLILLLTTISFIRHIPINTVIFPIAQVSQRYTAGVWTGVIGSYASRES